VSILDRLQWSEPKRDATGKLWREGSYSETGDPGRLGSRLDELEDAVREAGGEVVESNQSVHEGPDAILFRCRVAVETD
jgi:hypothetical protein